MKCLIDSTLREGSQAVGLVFSLSQKKEIFHHLLQAGLEEIELGVATELDPELPALVRYCRTIADRPRLALWCRCRPEDISYASLLQPDVLSLSIPASDIHIQKKLNKNRAWILARVNSCILQARKLGFRTISLGIEDATRSNPVFLQKIVQTAQDAGVDRIRLADTVGIAGPVEITGLIYQLKSEFAVELGIHAHNDFGMATANSIAALTAGAAWADVTVLGIGERAGNARLEEVAGYLTVGGQSLYQLDTIASLARKVAHISGITIGTNHPVIGDQIFHCETGLHLQGLKRDPETYEPFPPELVGARRKLLFGSKVGRQEIRDSLSGMGEDPSLHRLEWLVKEVRNAAAYLCRPLQQEELSVLLATLQSKNHDRSGMRW